MNFPVPSDFQFTPEAMLTVAQRGTEAVSLQTTISFPASVDGAFVNVIITVSVSAGQSALLVEIRSNVSLPFLMAAAVAVYVGFKTVLTGRNVPLPFHTPPPALVILPVKVTAGLFAHLMVSFPAAATGVACILTAFAMVSKHPEAEMISVTL